MDEEEINWNNKKEVLEDIYERMESREISFYDYMKDPDNCDTNLWWNIEADYMLFFGEDKKEIINYFIDSCYERDGKKEGIKKKLVREGYKL